MINQKQIPPLPERKINERKFLYTVTQGTPASQRSYIEQLSNSQVKDSNNSFRKSSLIIDNDNNTKSNGSLHYIPSPKGIHFSQASQNRSLKNGIGVQAQISALSDKLQQLSSMVQSHELKLSTLGNSSLLEASEIDCHARPFAQSNGRELTKNYSDVDRSTRKMDTFHLQQQMHNLKKEMHEFLNRNSSIKSDLISFEVQKILRDKLNNNNSTFFDKAIKTTENLLHKQTEQLKIQLAETIGKNNNILSNFIWKFEQNISNLEQDIKASHLRISKVEANSLETNDKIRSYASRPTSDMYSTVKVSNNRFMGAATILKHLEKFQIVGKENIWGDISIAQLIYKVDNEGYLLDNEGYYLVTEQGARIQLQQRHIDKLGSIFQKNYGMR